MSAAEWFVLAAFVVAVVFGLRYGLNRRALERELEETHHEVGRLLVTLTVDTSRFEAGMRAAEQSLRKLALAINEAAPKALENMTRMIAKFSVDWQRRREVKLAGLGARYYVRGGLECRTVEEVDALVQSILAGKEPSGFDAFTMLFGEPNRAERAELAVEAMKGYVLHMDPWRLTEPEPVGHRYVRSLRSWHWWGQGEYAVIDNLMTGRTYQGWGAQ